MIVARSLKEIRKDSNSEVTVGTFDGMHAGHQAIMKELTTRADARGGRSVVITFEPHPRKVVRPEQPFKPLSTLEERLEIMSGLRVDAVLVLEFTYDFSRQSSREFYGRYLIEGIGVREVIVGYDHMFGRDREAGMDELRRLGEEFGFGTHIVEPVRIDGEIVSSSRIREMIARGDVERAEKLLTRHFALEGTVVRGEGRGADIGFPTANIKPDWDERLLPANGVYFVTVDIIGGQQYFGMLNIGVRPTFEATLNRTIEVHLFDLHDDLYGKRLRVQFLKRLRAEKKFATAEDLVRQLTVDRDECTKYIAAVQPSS